jgi:aminoglycoside phosphotransferase (APT) family kinase protein
VELADVLSGDSGLAGVQWLLLGRSPRRALRGELATMLEDPNLLGPCRLRRAKFKPGRKLTASYDVHLRDSGARLQGRRPIAVTWTAEGLEHQSPSASLDTALESEAASRGLATPFHTLATAVPDRGMRILVSPLDARFPQLPRLSDPSFLAEVVRGTSCQVTPIRYRPGQRHVLRYDFEGRSRSQETVFAKLYHDDRGERTFEVACRVGDWLATNSAGAAAVRPLAYLSDSHAVLYPALCGGPLSQRLARSDADSHLLRRAGAVLRTLHRGPLTLADRPNQYELAAEISAIGRASQHIPVLLPEAKPRITALLVKAQELHDRLPQEHPAVAHGDFKLDHLWLGRDGFTLIDLDKCGVADPALDIGKFLADLHWWHLMADRTGVPEAQREFLDGYGAVRSSSRVRRARVYEAVLLVKIAARRATLFDRRWHSLTEDLVARGEKSLAVLERECRARRPSRSRRQVAATA